MLRRLFDCSPQAISVVCCAARQRISIASQKRLLSLLIREVIQNGIQLSEVSCPFVSVSRAYSNGNVQVFVDALGTTTTYEAYLSSLFPGINFTVTIKRIPSSKLSAPLVWLRKSLVMLAWGGWVFEEGSSPGAEYSLECRSWEWGILQVC